MRKLKKLLSLVCVLALTVTTGAFSVDVEGGNKVIRVACVGDSITDGGASAITTDSSYPGQLGLLLDGKKYEVYNCGKGGATAMKKPNVVPSYWSTDEFKLAKSCEPNIVIIMLGTNDIVNENWLDNATFETDLTALVQVFLDMPSVNEVYLCTPPSAYDSNHPALLRDYAVPIVKSIAEELNVPLVDMYAATQGHSNWYKDGIHPNDAGAVEFASILYREVFGMETGTLTVTTEPGNTVSLGSQCVKADSTGKAVLTVGTGKKTVRVQNGASFVNIEVTCRAGENEADCRGLLTGVDLAVSADIYDIDGKVTKVTDGDSNTGWQRSDDNYTNCWLAVDFGEEKTFDTVEIEWESSTRAKEGKYTIQTSEDGETWKDLTVSFDYSDALDVIDTGSVTTRYLRIRITDGKDGKSRPSLRELRIYADCTTWAGDLWGDTDLDGEIGAADLTVLARHVGGIELLEDQALRNANVDGEEGVTASDLTKLARFIGGIDDDL